MQHNSAQIIPIPASARSETRALLVYPRTPAITVGPPLGIGYMASTAERAGFRCDLIDLGRRDRDLIQFAKHLREQRYGVVGLSVSTANLETARETARTIRAALPAATFILGGPHTSAFPQATMADFDAQYAVVGEAEGIFTRFLEAWNNDPAIPTLPDGVLRLRDGVLEGKIIFDRPELDDLPWPAWEKLEPNRYPPIPHQLFVRQFPISPILTTRGCPMACSFCSSTRLFGARIRRRSVEDVVDEVRYLRDRFGTREIHFEDDNLTLNRAHAVRLFEALAEAQTGVWFKCPNGLQTNTLDGELFRLMKRAGMYQVSLGVETLAPGMLSSEKKFLDTKGVREVVDQAREAGLEVQGLFIAGLPGDDEHGFRRTVKDAMSMAMDLVHIGLFVPLPGSVTGDEIDPATMKPTNFFTAHQTLGEGWGQRWKALQRWAILRFYLRPRPIALMLSRMKLRQIGGVWRVFQRYVMSGSST